jgi:DNA-binding response OmpR family regulator
MLNPTQWGSKKYGVTRWNGLDFFWKFYYDELCMITNKFLIIDDEESIRNMVKEFLLIEGHQCDDAETPEQGLTMISKQNYDLILLDRNLGNIKAENFINRIHQFSPGVPIIILTGDTGCNENFLNEFGAAGIIFKPFLFTDLIEAISGFL